jgi:hypothetical protein
MKENTYDIIGTNYNSTRQADPFIANRFYYFPNLVYIRSLIKSCGIGTITASITKSIGLPADTTGALIFCSPSEQSYLDKTIRVSLSGQKNAVPRR